MKKTLLWILIFFVLFAPLQFRNFTLVSSSAEDNESLPTPSSPEFMRVIDEDETWTKDGGVEITNGVIIENGATLTIEPGTKVSFKKEEGGQAPFIWIMDGKIDANGTVEEGINFTSEQDLSGFFLIFDDRGGHESFFRYVTIEKGGGKIETEEIEDPVIMSSVQEIQKGRSSIFNIAVAEELPENPSVFLAERYPSVITYLKGRVHFENSKFIKNNDAVFYVDHYFEENEETEVQLEIVNSNFNENEKELAVLSNFNGGENINPEECASKLLLKNNWYGKMLGAQAIYQYPEDYLEKDDLFSDSFAGEKIVGMFFKQEMFRSNELIADPVVIVPGITCSGRVPEVGDWKLDPVLHTYDDLVDSLKRNGFVENINLFYFPYQWRDSNVETAKLLKEKVSEVKEKTKVSKVDLVAHSMGGLVARQFIQFEDKDNSIDQLITLGTPHRGSPEAYLKWEGGTDGFLGFDDSIAKNIFRAEAFHELYGFDLHRYIQERVPSVGELLPDYDYLFDVKTDSMREYPENYPRNEFLENLNKEENIKNLEKVDFVNIMGEVDLEASTLSKIKIENSSKEDKWEHGMPEDFYDGDSKNGLVNEKGDETVPIFSAKSAPVNKIIEINSKHNQLPTKAQCEVFKELTQENNCSYDEDAVITNVLTFGVFSPIDVQVVAPDGKRIGKNFETGEIFNEIEKAFYSGFETENEFVTIPNPMDGEYRILTQGVGNGEYRIEVAKIQEEEGEAKESMIAFEGVSRIGQEEEKTFKISENEIVGGEEKDELPPTIEISSPEEGESYTNNVDLEISVNVEDDSTAQEKIEIQMRLDEELFEGNELELPLMPLGEHSFEVQTMDEAGNKATKEINFSTKTDIDALISNVSYYYDKGLIKNKREEKVLTSMLLSIKSLMLHRDHFLIYKKFYRRDGRMEEMFERMINWRIDSVVRFIERRGERFIDDSAKSLLIGSLQYLKIN